MTKLDDVYVCIDCHYMLEIGDLTYFDSVYEPEMAQKRIMECETGMLRLLEVFGENTSAYSSGKEMDFSRFPCQCCYNKDAGERYKIIIYGEEKA